MSYHDGYIKPGSTGISVVNPLHEVQLKLDKITQLVSESSTAEHEDAGVISIEHLRMILTLQNILDGTDDEKDVK